MSSIELKINSFNLTPKVMATLPPLLEALSESEEEQNKKEQAIFDNFSQEQVSADTASNTIQEPVTPTVVQSPAAPVQINQPMQQQTPPVVTQTMPVAPVTQPAAPTTAPSYSLEDLANAAAPLMSAGKQQQLTAVLQQFGVQSLKELSPQTYPTVAQQLRGLGAKI